MALAILKYASNEKYKDLQGRIGELNLLKDGRFVFEYLEDGRKKTLCSTVLGHFGEPDDIHSKEVNIQTERSFYDFEKLENYIDEDKVLDDTMREALCAGLDEMIKNAEVESRETQGISSKGRIDDFELV